MLIERRADVAPNTLDQEARSIEVIASTFADVKRAGYVERLDPAGFDPEALVGKPVLDGHQRDSVAHLLGVVTAARIEDGKLVATLKLSERAAGVLADIKAAIKPQVSIGYTVERWQTAGNVRTATRWAIHEVSSSRSVQTRAPLFEQMELISWTKP